LMPYSWRVTSHLADLFLIEIEPDLKRRLGASIQER
jgi:hypothetical protein